MINVEILITLIENKPIRFRNPGHFKKCKSQLQLKQLTVTAQAATGEKTESELHFVIIRQTFKV